MYYWQNIRIFTAKYHKFQNKEIMKRVNEFILIAGTPLLYKGEEKGEWAFKIFPKKGIQIFFTKGRKW